MKKYAELNGDIKKCRIKSLTITKLKETFLKIEELILNKGRTSESIASLKDIIRKECVTNPSNKDGFKHNPESYSVEFYNGSSIYTLNSKPDNIRGKHKYISIYKNKSIKEEIIMRSSIWTNEEIDYLKKNYNCMTNAEMALELGRTKSAVDIKLNKLGIKKGKYSYDRDFFKNIDTEEKAYWLGFIYADGYIVFNDTKPVCYELGIELNSRDKNHLKKFNKSIHGNIQVTARNRINPFNNEYVENSVIRLYSKDLVFDLIQHGVSVHKSSTIDMPDINSTFMPHFIRGYFDGDGCVCNDNKNRKTIACNFTTGSEAFAKKLREYLYSNKIFSYIIKEGNVYRIYIKGMKNCCNFLQFIYLNSNIFLDRKYFKASNLLKKYDYARRLPLQPEMVGFFKLGENRES